MKLDQADSARASFIVPEGASELAFQLVVAGPGGVDRTTLEVPVEKHKPSPIPEAVAADAGEDRVAVVGQSVTLNGNRNKPRDQAACRWIQIAGPAISKGTDTSWTYSFVPHEPGKYRFLLIVAGRGAIAEPDAVEVSVLPSGSIGSEQNPSSPSEGAPIGQAVRSRIAGLGDWPEVAPRLAEAFDAVADRMALYESYDGVFSEIDRRIGAVLPATSPHRAAWDKEVFEPLSGQIIRDLRGVGLDLSRAQERARPYDAAQRAHLTGLFHGIAAGFRASDRSDAELSGKSARTKSP